MFWNDISNSIWIGGNGDGGLHERAPYWLNGIVPLAALLQNAGEEMLAGTAGIYKSSSVHGKEISRPTFLFFEHHASSFAEHGRSWHALRVLIVSILSFPLPTHCAR